jgi:TatD DNase family protein
MLFDTHAHLDAEEYRDDLPEVIEQARLAGVGRILSVATSLNSSRDTIAIAGRFPEVVAAVGIHPNYCQDATDADWESVAALAGEPHVVAIGETGLDRYRDYCPFERQLDFFERHLQLSRETGLPFIVHMRDCEADVLEVLGRWAAGDRLHGIMHSWCGSPAAMRQFLEWGMMISFSGMVTYPRNGELREMAAAVPGDRLLVETDAPWLSPHPHRSVRRNTPAMVRHTLDCIAKARGVEAEQLEATTFSNATRLFGLAPADCPSGP